MDKIYYLEITVYEDSAEYRNEYSEVKSESDNIINDSKGNTE